MGIIERDAIEWSMKSLEQRGDTDLFPRPVEFAALADNLEDCIDALVALDISQHTPGPFRRFIVPKDDLSYRAATQLDPLSSVLATSLIYQYGEEIEARRRAKDEAAVFSYRFSPSGEGDLYDSQGSWNHFWEVCHGNASECGAVLYVDIADFYNQVSHHSVETQLTASGLPNQAQKWLSRLLQADTAKVSRGIPVGPHAVHLLAEASLIPVDNSLSSQGIKFCRFVDDIFVFAKDEIDARRHVYHIAGVLDKQQRLQVQKSKTRIFDPDEFKDYCATMIEDRPINDIESKLLNIVRKHSRGNPYQTVYISDLSEEDLRAFGADSVEAILEDYLSEDTPDYVRLRWFIRRLSQVGHGAGVEYCLANYKRMIPALSDICRYFLSVSDTGQTLDWESVGDRLEKMLDDDIIQSNEFFQISLLALFSRKPELNHMSRLIQRYRNTSPYIRRKIILAAASANHVDWLRELKEAAPSMDPWTKRAYMCACRSLPKEERKFILQHALANSQDSLDKLIYECAKK